jgi:hypothetical protein
MLVLILGLVLAGCQTNGGAGSGNTPVVAEATVPQQASAVQQVAEDPTVAPTSTTSPPTVTVIEASPTLSPTLMPTNTATRTPIPSTNTPTPPPTATPTLTPVPADAVVTAAQLNVRSGPGTTFGTVAALAKGDALDVTGQAENCAWLQVRTTGGIVGWVAHVVGSTEYTTLNIPCDSVTKVVVVAPTPSPRPQPAGPPAAARLPVKQAILTPDDYADILPTTMCMMNAFKEDETFYGYMCFVATKPIGASEVTMLIYTMRACPTGGACPSNRPDGQKFPLPASPSLPADASLIGIADGGVTLTATANGYALLVSLNKGNQQLVSQKLVELAARQFAKIR